MSFYYLEKCQKELEKIKESISDYKTSIYKYWSGEDANELITQLTKLERDYRQVIKSINQIKKQIETISKKQEEI